MLDFLTQKISNRYDFFVPTAHALEQEDSRLPRKYQRVPALKRLEEIRAMKEEEGLTIKQIKERLERQSYED